MAENSETETSHSQIDRRRFLRHIETGAAVAGAAWVLPAITSGTVAFADGSTTTTTDDGPPPTVTPAVLGWTDRTPTVSPPGRRGASMATLPDGTVVLFGGYGTSDYLNDTWVFNGNTWSQISGTPSPPARHFATMASGPGGTVVLFGGGNSTGNLGDTWVWDGV